MTAASPALVAGNPYPGLRPFERSQAALFFGREDQTGELLLHLHQHRFVGVVGLSGSGKSSLVRAGLIPALERGFLPAAGSRWRIAVMRPGSHPLQALAGAMDSPEALGTGPNTLTILKKSSYGLIHRSRHGRRPDENLLVVADQFEELVRVKREQRGSSDEAEHFVRLLLTAAEEQEPEFRIFVVLTMRSDYLGECAAFRGLPEALNRSQYLVPRMTSDQLREAMEGPAALSGVSIEIPLIERLLADAGDDPDQLPVLGHLLRRMWERRQGSRLSLHEYEDAGGWEHALDRQGSELLDALAPESRQTARRIFQRLTEKAERGRDSRRIATFQELVDVCGGDENRVRDVAVHFCGPGRNFLSCPEQVHPETDVDLSHESLIRKWQELNRWAEEEAEWARWYRRVEDRAVMYFGEYKESIEALMGNPDLGLALENRLAGRWDENWALRYARGPVLEEKKEAYRKSAEFLRRSEQEWQRDQSARRRRRRRALVSTAALALVFAVLAGVLLWQWRKTSNLQQLALARQLAVTAELLYADSPESLDTSTLLAAESLRRANLFESDRVLRRNLPLLRKQRASLQHEGLVAAVDFSPDIRWLATASDDGTARVFDAATGKEAARLAHDMPVQTVKVSPRGDKVVTGSDDSTARLFDPRTGNELARLEHQGHVRAVTFSADGTKVATASDDGKARVFDTATGRLLLEWPHRGPVRAVAFSPDGKEVATGSEDGLARLFVLASRTERAQVKHSGTVGAVVFSTDGRWVTTGSDDGTARVLDARTGREISRLTHRGPVRGVAFGAERNLVATASDDGTARVFEAESGKELARLVHQGAVRMVLFGALGRRVVTASEDGTARMFEAVSGEELARLSHSKAVGALTVSRDGQWLATGSADGAARVFEVRAGSEAVRLSHQRIAAAVLSRDGKLAATGGWDATARVFNARTGDELSQLKHGGPVWVLAFSSDGRLVATGSEDGSARVFDPQTARVVMRSGHGGPVRAVTFSPDGKLLASGGWDASTQLVEVATGKVAAKLAHKGSVGLLVFSRDGTRLMTGSEDGTATVLDTGSAKEMFRLNHPGAVRAAAISPDGRWLATGSLDEIGRVFEAATGKEVARLRHRSRVWVVAFSPDGRWLATGGLDETARVFETGTWQERAQLLHNSPVQEAEFSPDGKLLATGCLDGSARVFLAEQGREIARISHSGTIRRVAFNNGGRYLDVVAESDPTTREVTVTRHMMAPDDLIAEACSRLTANLSLEQWRVHLGDESYRKTCPDLPGPETAAIPSPFQ